MIENKHPCTGITERLTAPTEALSIPQVAPSLGLCAMLRDKAIWAGIFGAIMFSVGWVASVLYRTVQIYIEARGSYAVFAICFAVPLLLVWRGNHKIANSWPSDWP